MKSSDTNLEGDDHTRAFQFKFCFIPSSGAEEDCQRFPILNQPVTLIEGQGHWTKLESVLSKEWQKFD